MKHFINIQEWSKEEAIDIFYFSSFDEPWKEGTEGDVGAFWGLWDKNEKYKFYPESLLLNKESIVLIHFYQKLSS